MANVPYVPAPTDLVQVIPVLGNGSQSPETQLSQVLTFGTGTHGTVTSIVAGSGLNVGAGPGGTITTTGTLNVAIASGATGSRPSVHATGQPFFDTTLGTPIWWSGTAWVNAIGAPV